MDYLEYDLVTSDEPTAEILMALLAEIGFDTFEQSENELSAYIPEKGSSAAQTEAYLSELQQKFVFTWQSKKYEDKNWNHEWEKNYQPVIIANRCFIRAPFHESQPQFDFEIIIEPRMSFGTGHHESTCLMIQEMLGLNFKNKIVCDAGCGTGILSILASTKGAAKVFAIDNNEWAYHNTIGNIAHNKIYYNIETELGELDLLENKQFDIILANLNRYIILQNISLFFRCMNAGGLLIISGILVNDLPVILKEAKNYFFREISTNTKGDWVCAVLQNG